MSDDNVLTSCTPSLAGKVGAIVAGVVLDQISDQNKFIVSAITGLIGFVITIIFVPGAPLLHSYSITSATLLLCYGTRHSAHELKVAGHTHPKAVIQWHLS